MASRKFVLPWPLSLIRERCRLPEEGLERHVREVLIIADLDRVDSRRGGGHAPLNAGGRFSRKARVPS